MLCIALRICCECGLTWKTLDIVFFVSKRNLLLLKQKKNLIQSNLTTVLRTFGQLSDLSYTLILSSEERETVYNDVVAFARMRYYGFIRPLPKLTKRHSSLPYDDENDIIRRSLVLCFSTHLFSESCTCFHAAYFSRMHI